MLLKVLYKKKETGTMNWTELLEIDDKSHYKTLIGAAVKRIGFDLLGNDERIKKEALDYLSDPDPEFLRQVDEADLLPTFRKLQKYAKVTRV
jgi:hypothetical protein